MWKAAATAIEYLRRAVQLRFVGIMTPATVKQAAETLARAVENRHVARSEGAALGRTLAAEIRAKEIATEQMNAAAAKDLELALLQLAASGDELVAEVADSALKSLREHGHVGS